MKEADLKALMIIRFGLSGCVGDRVGVGVGMDVFCKRDRQSSVG